MTTPILDALTTAAFWSEHICLACGATQPDLTAECAACGEPALAPAQLVQSFIALLEDSDG